MTAAKYIPVAALAELSDMDGKCVRVGEVQIALFKSAGGDVCAIGNICPHQGGPLAEGIYDIDEGVVTCPLHAWDFDVRTGKRVNGIESVPSYPIRIVGDTVEVLLGGELL